MLGSNSCEILGGYLMNWWFAKKVGGFLFVLLVGTLLIAAKPASAAASTSEMAAAQATISDFLSSVTLGGAAYIFDHDSDGVVDMAIYPVRTTMPDTKTRYTTLQEALAKNQLALRESNQMVASRNNAPGSYPIVAQIMGGYGRRSYGSYGSYGSGGYSGGGYGSYYPRGGMLSGGYQNRGFRSGGFLGGGYSGYGNYGRNNSYGSGYRGGYGRGGAGIGFRNAAPDNNDLKELASAGVFDSHGTNNAKPAPVLQPVDALCFEKWRLIQQSRLRGVPEYFTYVGMASPFIRRELMLFSNQTNIHMAIEIELRKLGINSRTRAISDVLADERVRSVIDYYTANSKQILNKNKEMTGMVVVGKNRILCADFYSSRQLFSKMFPQLMQSAAVGVCRMEKAHKQADRSEVQKFLAALAKVRKLRKETDHAYRVFYPKMISGAELLTDDNGTRVVHLEAYLR